jgi:hypothetical protein
MKESIEYLDEQFPKGKNKFRGNAMVLIAITRREEEDKWIEFIEKLKEKVLTNWKGQNEFVDWIDRKIGEEK